MPLPPSGRSSQASVTSSLSRALFNVPFAIAVS